MIIQLFRIPIDQIRTSKTVHKIISMAKSSETIRFYTEIYDNYPAPQAEGVGEQRHIHK